MGRVLAHPRPPEKAAVGGAVGGALARMPTLTLENHTPSPSARARPNPAEERARPTTPWRYVFAALFLTFAVMLAAIYWIIRTGKL